MVRHVQTSESAASTLNVVNDDDDDEEKENDATVSAATATTATVSFEMKAGKPRKSSSLKRSESGGVRPKEKLHGTSSLGSKRPTRKSSVPPMATTTSLIVQSSEPPDAIQNPLGSSTISTTSF